MVKRVSLKGKGAEIFFGGESVEPAITVPPEAVPEIPEAPVPGPAQSDSAGGESQQASVQESMQARKQESMQASEQAGKHARTDETTEPSGPAPTEVLNAIWPALCERAAITNAFRYTDHELGWLTDVLYEVTKRHSIRLTKQDIARLGLLAVLEDYRTHGEASLLGELVARRKHERGSR